MKKEVTLLNESFIVDAFLIYKFLKLLTTSFKDTEAFKLGIIDAEGNVLRKRNTLKTSNEKSAFTLFHILIFNLKKIIAKVPGGSSKLGSFIAGLYLIKEGQKYTDEDDLYENFMDFYYETIMNEEDMKTVKQLMKEAKNPIDDKTAQDVGNQLNVDWDKIDFQQFKMGLEIEHEHDDVVNGDIIKIAKIALAHLKEVPDYYTKLKKVEEDAPANAVGGGGVAGLNQDPIVRQTPPMVRRKKLKDFIEIKK